MFLSCVFIRTCSCHTSTTNRSRSESPTCRRRQDCSRDRDFQQARSFEVSAVAVESMWAVEIGGLGAVEVERRRRPLAVELERREPLGMERILKWGNSVVSFVGDDGIVGSQREFKKELWQRKEKGCSGTQISMSKRRKFQSKVDKKLGESHKNFST